MGLPASNTSAFIGRDRELGELRAAFDDAVNGNGRLVMVVGEQGIGKTALCEELAGYVQEQGGTTLIGHCYEEGSLSLPYLPFVQAMRSYVLSRSEDDLRADLGDSASHAARIMPEIRDKLGAEPGAPTDPEEDRYRLLSGVTTFLTNASKSRPLLIILEDLHDADGGTLEMLTYLSGFLSETNVLVVGTYRDLEVDRAHPLASALVELRSASTFGRVALRGLGLEDVRRMMTAVSGESITEHLAVTVHRQTEGNPLLVQEVARYLREEQALTTSDGEVELRVPEGVRDVIGKRLSRLSKECNQMLAVASVIGRDFDLGILLEASRLSEDDLYTQLEEAQGASVVGESSGLRGGLSYRFSHAMMRETLYGEIFAPRRIRLHQQVGRALEGVYAGRLEEHTDELTEHFAQSTELEDPEKALKYGEMAAERGMSVYAYSETVRLLEQALQVQEVLDPENKAKRCDLLIALGKALMPAGDSLHVYENISPEAFTLAEAIGDDDRASRVCRLAVDAVMRYSADIRLKPEFRVWADRFDRLAAPGTRHRVLADLALSMMYLSRDTGETWRLRKRALDLSRELDDQHSFATTASMIFMHSWAPQHEKERLELVREVGEKYVKMESGTVRGGSDSFGQVRLDGLAKAYLEMGERARAEELWGELRERATRTQDANSIMASLKTEAIVATLDGRLEDALVVAETLRSKGEEFGMPRHGRGSGFSASLLPLSWLGRMEESALPPDLEGNPGNLLAALREESDIPLLYRASLLALSGAVEEVSEVFRRVKEEGGHGEEGNDTPAHVLRLLLNLAVLVEDREAAQGLYGRLSGLSDQPMSHQFLWGVDISASIPRVLRGAAALLGENQAARVHYDKALELMGKIRFRPEIALTHLELAELLVDRFPDEHVEGLEHLDFAIAELRDMKMQPALERALGLQEKLEIPKPAAPTYPDGLSRREVEVLLLIAQGNSHQQIADDLFISHNTVANHVRNILTKTDSANRAEAASYAVRQGLTPSQ